MSYLAYLNYYYRTSHSTQTEYAPYVSSPTATPAKNKSTLRDFDNGLTKLETVSWFNPNLHIDQTKNDRLLNYQLFMRQHR
jgi:hypothetical protein